MATFRINRSSQGVGTLEAVRWIVYHSVDCEIVGFFFYNQSISAGRKYKFGFLWTDHDHRRIISNRCDTHVV